MLPVGRAPLAVWSGVDYSVRNAAPPGVRLRGCWPPGPHRVGPGFTSMERALQRIAASGTLISFGENGVVVVVPPKESQTASAGSGPGPLAAPQKFPVASADASAFEMPQFDPDVSLP